MTRTKLECVEVVIREGDVQRRLGLVASTLRVQVREVDPEGHATKDDARHVRVVRRQRAALHRLRQRGSRGGQEGVKRGSGGGQEGVKRGSRGGLKGIYRSSLDA
eukprot:616579-Prorocentrum_minimum.AAC.1